MSKKDYEKAASIAQEWARFREKAASATDVMEAFCELFREPMGRFDEARFRAACVPGANVRARGAKVTA